MIDDEEKAITIQLQVRTNGWAGIGFSPEEVNTMKGAGMLIRFLFINLPDIVLCRTQENYFVPICSDSKALDVGPPSSDDSLSGGSYNLRDVSVERLDGVLYV